MIPIVLATINVSAKFEVSNSIHYEDTKGDTTYQKWDGLGVVKGYSRSLELAPFDGAHTNSW